MLCHLSDVEIFLFEDCVILMINFNNEISKQRTMKTCKDVNNLNFDGFGM